MRSTRQRILCVDNHEDTCWMLSIILGQAGYEVRTASGVVEAMKLAESEWFDLYILDQIYADGRGTDLCSRIRTLHPTTPIIFFSSLVHISDRRLGLNAGADDYLIKPNDLGRLDKTVARLTGNSSYELAAH